MKSHLRIAPMIFIMGVIFFLSHQTGDSLKLPVFYGADKVAHFLAYAVLGVTVVYAHPLWQTMNLRLLNIRIFAVVFLYGLSDEFHQSFIPMRYVSVADVVADCCGGIAIIIALYCWRKKRAYFPLK